MTDSQSQSPGLLANILAVAGFIILIVIIVWGAYHLLRLLGTGISSLFTGFGKDQIVLSLPEAPVESGKEFKLEWEYSPAEPGTYALLYQCKEGFRFETSAPANAGIAIPCGNAFSIGDTSQVTLVPTLTTGDSIDVPLSLVFLPSATTSTDRPQGTGTLTVIAPNNGSVTPPVNTGSTQTPTITPAGGSNTVTPQPTGKPDLAVRIIAVGVINQSTGLFENRYPTSPEDVAAVKFDIANNGSASTGTYYFHVALPIQGGQAYTSPMQSNLTPGSHVENTLRFKPVQPGGGTISVSADPSGSVSESNESNNTASAVVNIPTWSGYYPVQVY